MEVAVVLRLSVKVREGGELREVAGGLASPVEDTATAHHHCQISYEGCSDRERGQTGSQVCSCDSLEIHHLHHSLHLTTFSLISGAVFTGVLAEDFCDGVCKYWPDSGQSGQASHSLGIRSARTLSLTVQEQAELTTV